MRHKRKPPAHGPAHAVGNPGMRKAATAPASLPANSKPSTKPCLRHGAILPARTRRQRTCTTFLEGFRSRAWRLLAGGDHCHTHGGNHRPHRAGYLAAIRGARHAGGHTRIPAGTMPRVLQAQALGGVFVAGSGGAEVFAVFAGALSGCSAHPCLRAQRRPPQCSMVGGAGLAARNARVCVVTACSTRGFPLPGAGRETGAETRP